MAAFKRAKLTGMSTIAALDSLELGLGAAAIRERTDAIVERHARAWDAARVSLAAEATKGLSVQATFAATFGSLAAADDEAALASGSVTLPALISADPAARAAGAEAKLRLKSMYQRAEGNAAIASVLQRTWDSCAMQRGAAPASSATVVAVAAATAVGGATVAAGPGGAPLSPQQVAVATAMLRACGRAGALVPDVEQRARVAVSDPSGRRRAQPHVRGKEPV